jgi:hypothetical protein
MSFERLSTNGDKETFTSIDVPQIGIYTTFFPSNYFFVQPELAFARESGGGVSATGLGLLISPAWAFSGVTANSFYVAPTGGLVWSDFSDDEESDSETDYTAGALAGYRLLIRDQLAMRFEGAYYRQFPETGDDTNLFVIRIGIGGLLHSGATRSASR